MSPLTRRLRHTLPLLLICISIHPLAAAPLVPLGAAPDGTPSLPWREIRLGSGIAANQVRVEETASGTVLVLQSDNSASGVGQPLNGSADALLSWYWKVAAPMNGPDPTTREGDDYAARVYVLFGPRDGTTGRLRQWRQRLLGWMSGVPVPETTLCYVWAGEQAVPDHYPSPYSEDVQILVVERGAATSADGWAYARRNLLLDHTRAFNRPPGPVIGLILAADSDNGGSRATARFRDVELIPATSPSLP